MNSFIFKGQVSHIRLTPKAYSFSYPYYGLAFDPRDLTTLEFWPLLSAQSAAIFRINQADYLDPESATFAEKLLKAIPDLNSSSGTKIVAITMPKLFGYVFNPVTFYVCHESNFKITKLLCEVNNTFGERFLYALENANSSDESGSFFIFPKEFYVSPFFKTVGSYQIKILLTPDNNLKLNLNLSHEGQDIFKADLNGQLVNLRLLTLIIYSPLIAASASLAMIRIHIQALILYFKIGARYQEKPSTYTKKLLSKFTNTVGIARLFVLKKLMSSKE